MSATAAAAKPNGYCREDAACSNPDDFCFYPYAIVRTKVTGKCQPR
ncbi:MAG: hypothetical protein QM778_02210 [Myxococcales bacterium]